MQPQASLYGVFVTVTLANSWGTSVQTNFIPALDMEHAYTIKEQIDNGYVEGSYLEIRTVVIGGRKY